ncbi:Protein of unknown function [Muriicola jejuensis]|uniref:DUF3052 domain-containing protein n=1 Tax=Muriicola jejuensis TaxID=504488 RepID=A0A6P0U8B4_9FLAO|nr:DUF3052 domain-containing protein [Muriicola jejuensis]NER09377.1 DUF3052 domain-containing protein [Muriicola jejuensis]SMP08990.1 Protein of unknown function [Muriicola jejuensis]
MKGINPLGYSGTPLAKKLGIKRGQRVKLFHPPEGYFDLFEDLPDDFELLPEEDTGIDFIHYFALQADQLDRDLGTLRKQLNQTGMIWISWPKKASKVPTDLDGNVVRDLGLRHGLVDIKVCSVNEIWSALKFVIPVRDRTA